MNDSKNSVIVGAIELIGFMRFVIFNDEVDVTVANVVIGIEIMLAEECGSINHHEPTGGDRRRYAGIGLGGWMFR